MTVDDDDEEIEDKDQWELDMERQVQTAPPSCLAGFRVTPTHAEPWDNNAAWALACNCGGTKGKLLGHPLKDFNPDYDGPEFVSPLGFGCLACGQTTEILDTQLHGYNSEIDKLAAQPSLDSNYRGTGERQAFACPGCRATEFSITALFQHSHFDLIAEQPELAPRAQDFFDSFDCRGKCTVCGLDSSLANFETA